MVGVFWRSCSNCEELPKKPRFAVKYCDCGHTQIEIIIFFISQWEVFGEIDRGKHVRIFWKILKRGKFKFFLISLASQLYGFMLWPLGRYYITIIIYIRATCIRWNILRGVTTVICFRRFGYILSRNITLISTTIVWCLCPTPLPI